ncbi:MAG: creatininase family protein [Anaerolineales bacterium]|nr:MAG: creatininase family protein [Anaerolineales bacterium]
MCREESDMQWENLTSLDFEKAVKTCQGVGIIPVGVIEAHGPHLPLGTDAFEAHWTACQAAEEEPSIVFPFYPYGINHESSHLPGAVVIKRDVVLALLENICDEMARHGLTKIILFSGHGGNRFMLPLFVQTLVEQDKPYVVYYANVHSEEKDVLETMETGHACESETSTLLYIHEPLVKMDQVPPQTFTNLKRNQPLVEVGAYSPMDWYAMYPHMYVGDASKATVEKGRVLSGRRIAGLVTLIKRVKADVMTPALLKQYIQQKAKPTAPDFWTEPKP